MGPLHRAHIHLYPQARGVGDLDAPVFELQGCLSEVLAVLPDVVGVDGGDLPRRGGSALDKGGQGDVEVVIGVDAPGQAQPFISCATRRLPSMVQKWGSARTMSTLFSTRL